MRGCAKKQKMHSPIHSHTYLEHGRSGPFLRMCVLHLQDQKKLFGEDFVNGLHAGLAQYNCTIWSRGSGRRKRRWSLKVRLHYSTSHYSSPLLSNCSQLYREGSTGSKSELAQFFGIWKCLHSPPLLLLLLHYFT